MRLFCCLLAAGLAAGCSGGHPKTHPVTAVVRVNGKPATGANVTLHPIGATWAGQLNHRPFGKVRDDGTVSFATFDPADGAPAGDYVVTVYWPDRDRGDADRLGGTHESPDRPNPIRVTVAAGTTELRPIDLTTVKRGGN